MDQGGPEMTPAGEPQNEGERMCPPSQFVPEYLKYHTPSYAHNDCPPLDHPWWDGFQTMG